MGYSSEEAAAKKVADADAYQKYKEAMAKFDYKGAAEALGNSNSNPTHDAAARGGGNAYQGPGAADFGGYTNGVDIYKKEAMGHMADNDVEQAANAAAMRASGRNISKTGAQSTENTADSQQAIRTRAQQLSSLEQNRQAAMGNAPSEAAFQTGIGMNDNMASQAGAMGGARGLAGLSGAQTGGNQAMGQASGNLAMTGGMARSKEIGDALGMYGSAAGGVRDQDFKRLGISDQNNMFNAKASDDWKLGNAGLLANQSKLGAAMDARDDSWFASGMEPEDIQFQYDQEMAAEMAGANADEAGARIARNRESTNSARGMVNGGITAGLTAVGSLAGPVGSAAGAGAGGMFSSATKKYW